MVVVMVVMAAMLFETEGH